MNNNTTPNTPATLIVTPAKDNSAVGQAPAPAQKTAPVEHAPKPAPAVVPTPKI